MDLKEYRKNVREDIEIYISENGSLSIYDIEDAVTGSASGSYYCSSYEAKEAFKDVVFDDDVLGMFIDYGYERVPIEKGAEFCDCALRLMIKEEILNECEGHKAVYGYFGNTVQDDWRDD